MSTLVDYSDEKGFVIDHCCPITPLITKKATDPATMVPSRYIEVLIKVLSVRVTVTSVFNPSSSTNESRMFLKLVFFVDLIL